jgi:hypothetical protein
MAKTRKPRTKTQQQISNEQVEPYVNQETGETLGNPNQPSSFEQFTKTEQSGNEFNRSEKISFRNDTTKPFTVGIQDMDESVMYYFNEVIRPTVQQNGQRIAVPVIYGAPERWKSAQKDGYYKDKNGKIMAPIIMFKRDSVTRNNSITNKMDANQPHLYATWATTYNKKNSYSNFDLLNNRKPIQTYQLIVIPDYVNLSYSCTIQTYYVDQLNKIVEVINYASNAYWGDPERFKFKADIDSFSTTTELNDGQDRIVKATFTIKMSGYIIPDNIQKEISAHRKFNSKAQVIVSAETYYSGSSNI